jgi:hypothetical protein
LDGRSHNDRVGRSERRDPRVGTSADGTTIPPPASIVDKKSSVWTLSGGSVYLNGVKAGNNSLVSGLFEVGRSEKAY